VTPDAAERPRVSGTWTACRTATADLSGSSAARPLLFPNGPPGCCHAERTPTIPTHLDAAVACDRSGTGPVSGYAVHELPYPQGYHRDHYVSPLVAGGRTLAGHPSGASDRRGHQHGHRHQRGHVCRIQPVRTAVVPQAADGQSAGRSGSLQLPYSSSRPACGRPPAAAVLGRHNVHAK
jgi:hypothetical protein